LNSNNGTGSSISILNMWKKSLNKGVSDYDVTHQFNANWLAELPIGRGKRFAGGASRALDAIIGGWQLSGVYRITSGLPFSIGNGATYWPTSSFTGFATPNGKPGAATQTVKLPDGSVSMFADRLAAFNAYDNTLPGGVGSRNTL